MKCSKLKDHFCIVPVYMYVHIMEKATLILETDTPEQKALL